MYVANGYHTGVKGRSLLAKDNTLRTHYHIAYMLPKILYKLPWEGRK